MEKKKKNTSTLIGAAFIMATSAIGPGFLTQSAKFTSDLQGSFGFVILSTIVLAIIVQLNVWRVLCVSGLRGQDIGNRLLPGLGHFVAFLVVLGGLVFNIGNVGGAALGFNTLLGIPTILGYFLAGGVAILVFLLKNAIHVMDNLTKVLGGLMIIVIFIVILIVQPPMGMAIRETVLPSAPTTRLFPAILTLLGGTVGGYITFAGAHRLIDAGITKKENLSQITQSSLMGIGIASIVRLFLFLAILGVVVKGVTLDVSNPAADAFRQGGGTLGYRFFGLVLLSAAISSIIGAAYTSVSFLKTISHPVAIYEKWVIISFIAISTVVMALLGNPASLLVIAGSLNGLILPITLSICLVASQRNDIMGDDYHHPTWLLAAGIIVVLLTAYIGIQSLGNLTHLFQ
ncbi:NRAMP family divalent metal transporter [Tuanshanicoccus lijuaniae]|uniref:NRAMP family divalent metal transporter n=1 Tax=Aerococcaceae bacterium zg-1292 TaxID=2774330 RepID=UPI001BD80B07|nr:divalent metal cation transporter [Aerococcaceae bacterium zg-A91]MBS4458521.1 divalent metal cation transporter [Aerococcaceae bacterium zg-BR33]